MLAYYCHSDLNFVPKKIGTVTTSPIMALLLFICTKERGLEQLCLKSFFIEAFHLVFHAVLVFLISHEIRYYFLIIAAQ